jgi:hypothetical protein
MAHNSSLLALCKQLVNPNRAYIIIVMCINKLVLFRLSTCTLTLIRSRGRTDITLSAKYFKRSKRADFIYVTKIK